MTNAFASIQQGLMEAIELAEDKKKGATVHNFAPVDVKAVRNNVAMTQAEFASIFGISLRTLRHWERGDRAQRGPALVLLNVLAKDPQAVIKALS
ncbi:TPA: helix-turn-helix domain-containing protein [Photobacterium damselae]